MLKGLRKLHPSANGKRLPILLQHLRRIKRHLKLDDEGVEGQFDRTIWAFITTAWQGVRRSAELLTGKKKFEPERAMHRGRVKLQRLSETEAALFVELAPSKTDQTGEKHFTMQLPVDADADVNAATAILEMCVNAPLPEGRDPAGVALFVNPRTERPLTYHEAAAELKRLLILIGEPELASGLHSLRLGGSTTLAQLNASAATMGMFGLWGSDAYLGYIWAGQEAMLDMSRRMAATEVTLAPQSTTIR